MYCYKVIKLENIIYRGRKSWGMKECTACKGSFENLLMKISDFSNIIPKNACKSLIYKAFIMLETLTFNSNITRKSLIHKGSFVRLFF